MATRRFFQVEHYHPTMKYTQYYDDRTGFWWATIDDASVFATRREAEMARSKAHPDVRNWVHITEYEASPVSA